MQQKEINLYSNDYILEYLKNNYPQKAIRSIIPYSFTVGSNNNLEGLSLSYGLEKSLFYGFLYLCISPNDSNLAPEKIVIEYRSYLSQFPYQKRITRFVEQENLINENSSSLELFDLLTVTQESLKYDFYLTFVGFKIDLV